MRRGDIAWADLPQPVGRRPVLVVSPTRLNAVRTRVIVAPITTRIRGLRTEVALDRRDGVPKASVASCSDLLTIPSAVLDPTPLGSIDRLRTFSLDRALRFALGIRP